MATLTNLNPTDEPTLTLVQGSGGASPSNSGSLTQGGINPSAAAMLILYQVMAMYSKITGINAQEQKTQISAQKDMGQAEANATISAGQAYGWSMIAGAIASIVMTAVGTVVAVSASKSMKEKADDTQKLQEKIAPAKDLESLDSSITKEGTRSGEDNPQVTKRADELERGIYKGGKDEEELNKKAIIKLRQDRSSERYQAFRDRLDDRLSTFEKARNSNASDAQALSQIRSTIGNAVTGGGNSLSSISQGTGQMYKAAQDANASLQRSANSMAQQSGSTQADASRKAGDAQNAVVNVLNAIRQASSNV